MGFIPEVFVSMLIKNVNDRLPACLLLYAAPRSPAERQDANEERWRFRAIKNADVNRMTHTSAP